MSRKITAVANAILAIGLFVIAAIFSMSSHDESAATSAGLIGLVLLTLSLAVYAKKRSLVHAIAIPVLMLLCITFFFLLFAPLAWNERDAYILLGLVALMAALQIANLIVVRKREQ